MLASVVELWVTFDIDENEVLIRSPSINQIGFRGKAVEEYGCNMYGDKQQ